MKKKTSNLFCLILFFLATFISQTSAQNETPFYAWISTRDDVFLKQDFDRPYSSIALLRYGDLIQITECRPDCISSTSMVRIEPYGILRLSNISTTPRPPEAEFLGGSPSNFAWARITRNNVSSKIEQNNNSRALESFRRGDEIIIRSNPELVAQGWVQRPNLGYISINDISLFNPSTFSGWQNPPDNFIFILRDTTITDTQGIIERAYRYDRYPLISETRTLVTVSDGSIPRNDVRVGYKHNRPDEVPNGIRWVHVDLEQQILTAYNENDDLVFTTLVSTGRRRGTTHRGIFQVRRKISYTQMTGRGYSVEGVAWVQYLTGTNEHVAFHEAFWHDSFGTVKSHGCINLSPTDAYFIYNFNPAEVPVGWRSVHPLTFSTNNIWVVIE